GRVARIRVDDIEHVRLVADLIIVSADADEYVNMSATAEAAVRGDTPVVVAGPLNVDATIAALDAGATEVIRGDEQPEMITARLRAILRTSETMSNLKRQNRELDAVAVLDVLTRLPNRRGVDDHLRKLEAAASRRG